MTSRRKLLVVAGAGSSIELGMPSVERVGEMLQQASLRDFRLADDPARSLYDHILDAVTTCWRDNAPSQRKPRAPNFEDILYAIYALAGAGLNGVLTGTLVALIEPRPLPDVIRSNKRTLIQLGEHLIASLVKDFSARCLEAERNPKLGTPEYKRFFATLAERFDLT